MILRELFESKQRTVGIIFGRFNPPHQGHRAAWEMASENDTWYVGTNQSTQGPKDPLPYDIKVKAMQAVWPGIKGHIVPETSWLTLASKIYKKYGSITLNVYTDEEWVTKALVQYNGKEGAHGFYNFSDIQQQATPRLSSATALRAAVQAGDREAFANAAGVPADTMVAGKSFFDVVAHYLGQQTKVGTSPKRPARTGTRPARGHDEEPRYKEVAETDKHSLIGKFKRGEELYGKVKSSFKDISDAQKKGDSEAASKAFKKHERYANLRAPGTWNKVDEGDVVQFPKKHKGDLENTHDCPKCGGDLQGGKYMGHQVKVCMPCKQVYLPPNSGIDKNGNKIENENISRRGFLKGLGAAAAGVAAADANAIAGAFPSPSTREKWAKDAAESNRAEARRQAEKRKQELEKNTQEVDKAQRVNHHKLDEFAPDTGDDREPNEEEILRQLASRWWLGTEQQMAKAQKTLEVMGWEIGPVESGDDDAGVFLIRPGDEDGDTYIAFNHSDLSLDEGKSNAIANMASRLANKDDGKVAKLRAAGDKRREDQLKGRDFVKRDTSSKDEWGNLKENLNELSTELLGRYKKAAAADAKKADAEGYYDRGNKRFKGINRATMKQFDNDTKTATKENAWDRLQREKALECAGVGIITKQNSTVDVNKNTPKKNLKAFRLI